MSRWFSSTAKAHVPMVAEEEDQHLLSVEQALLKLLDDDIEEADRILKQHDSSYHYLGRGISSFIASMLGVEKELLKDAAAALQVAEIKTWEDMNRAKREQSAYKSKIYPPGTEYLLCYAISQLTSAITAVLSGSVTEAIRGFYKLRKAYLTLDGIMDIETKHFERVRASRESSVGSRGNTTSRQSNYQMVTPPATMNGSSARSSKEFTEEKDAIIGSASASNGSVSSEMEPSTLPTLLRVQSKLLDQDPATLGIDSHTDVFIHSGTRLCYGILLVVFSMIENPIFTKILYIVGFKGDRERGTRYLWQASRFNNFCSAIAGIALLGYYNGLVGFCDILPTDAGADDYLSGYPKAKCHALLADMRKRYPESKLWKLEEARMNSYDKNLAGAVKILAANSNGNMKQIATINMFEMSLTSMFYQDYQLCADSWIKCSEISKWSPTLYSFMAGASYLELYRNLRHSNPLVAEPYKQKAMEYIRKGPPLAGRQKVMSKELPFDVFIVRKVKKWEERASAWNVDLTEVIGVSPLAEMMYLWNGLKKCDMRQLQRVLDIIQWSRASHPEKHETNVDERVIQALLRATILRNLGRYEDTRELLKTEVLSHDKQEFRGHLVDDWALPSAHYEMAALAWNEKDLEGADHKSKVLECEQWLVKTKNWGESYVLDTRMSFKITTSLLTLKRHKSIMGY